MMYRRYAWYVLRHRWFVFLACCRLGIPWAGIVHDLSKFRPSELCAYARNFYGGVDGKGSRGGYPTYAELERTYHGDIRNQIAEATFFRWSKEHVQADFDYAWLLHIHRNKHHYQFWILKEDSGETKVLEIPERYIREMVADWIGAGRAIQGRKSDARVWYLGGKDKKVLAPNTRRRVEQLLGIA